MNLEYPHQVVVTYSVDATSPRDAIERIMREPDTGITRAYVRPFHRRIVNIPMDLWHKIRLIISLTQPKDDHDPDVESR